METAVQVIARGGWCGAPQRIVSGQDDESCITFCPSVPHVSLALLMLTVSCEFFRM